MFLTSSVLASVPGIAHGFGTREEPIPIPFLAQWEKLRPQWKQVHGTCAGEVIRPGQSVGDVDALFTRSVDTPIAIVTADCVPVLMARKDGSCVAAIHAGWRGTKGKILGELWKLFRAQGEKPQDWVAAIGPAIGPCCYQVSQELADEFSKEFQDADVKKVVPSERMLDLPWINFWELKQIGFAEIDLIRACTRCSGAAQSPLFHSFRRDGGGTRQWSMVYRLCSGRA